MPCTEPIISTCYDSPAGKLVLASSGDSLCMCDWLCSRYYGRNSWNLSMNLERPAKDGMDPVLEKAVRELDEYFLGERQEFDIPLLAIGTPFQKKVWSGIESIGYGRTMSYSELAASLGMPSSVRALAAACGRNPIGIFIPCHRVIGADGSLTGYAGGLARKSFLLELEKAHAHAILEENPRVTKMF